MAEKRVIESWIVKDTDGEYVTVRASAFECSSDGLKFFIDGENVAAFARWCYFRKLNA